jgi:hypothetical protein
MIATRSRDDMRAARTHHLRNPASDPTGSAGHDRYFSAEIEHAATVVPRSSGDAKVTT